MFDLPLIKPITLKQAKAAQRRLPSDHPKMAELELKIRKLASGYRGEKTLNYFPRKKLSHFPRPSSTCPKFLLSN